MQRRERKIMTQRTVRALSHTAAAALVLLALELGGAGIASAGNIEVRFTDTKDEAVEHAVVVAHGETPAAPTGASTATIDQVDKTFLPHVVVVEAGTRVRFPNSDNIRHHVYSFSQAKKFELPLYKGTPAEPVLFDRSGVVVLGCNIHDFMLGYVYVADSPYFAVSAEDGVARITELPVGTYEVSIWHPRHKGEAPPPRTVEVVDGQTATIAIRLDLKPDLQIQRARGARRKRY